MKQNLAGKDFNASLSSKRFGEGPKEERRLAIDSEHARASLFVRTWAGSTAQHTLKTKKCLRHAKADETPTIQYKYSMLQFLQIS